MTYHSQLNWIMLATIIGLAVFLYLKPQLQPEPDSEFQISLRDPATVQSIRIIRQGERATLQRVDNQWYFTSPFHARADTDTVEKILNVLSANSRQRILMSSLEDFNLDQPLIELYLDEDRFAFGGLAPTTEQQYLAINQHVYLVSPRYAIWIPVKPIDAVSSVLLSEEEVLVQFESPDWVVEREAGHGEWRMTDGDQRQLSPELLERWAQLWHTGQASELILDVRIREAAKPAVGISLQNGQNIQFQAWQDEYGMVLFRDDEEVGYYFSGSSGGMLLNPHHFE